MVDEERKELLTEIHRELKANKLDAKKLFAETQDFLKDQKELLDTLARNTLDFIKFFFEQFDGMDIWVEEENMTKHSDEFLIVKQYLEGRITGEFLYRMVFGSLGVDFEKKDGEE